MSDLERYAGLSVARQAVRNAHGNPQCRIATRGELTANLMSFHGWEAQQLNLQHD